MLPRRQIREEFFRLFQQMSVPETVSKGRINRYRVEDLPAVNVTTFSDQVIQEARVHGAGKCIDYAQVVTVELHMQAADNFEDELDDLESEFWVYGSQFSIDGVQLDYVGGEVTPVKDVETPQAVKLLTFTARYSVNTNDPETIIFS